MMALAMTFSDKETAVNMRLQHNYAEPYERVKTQLIDWALLFTTAHIFYEDDLSEDDKTLYRQMMTVFDSNSPTYHIALRDDKPVLVWNFGSLAIAVQMLFSLSITDDKKPIRVCKQCAKAFIPPRPNAVFCSSKCKNQYNVYKTERKINNFKKSTKLMNSSHIQALKISTFDFALASAYPKPFLISSKFPLIRFSVTATFSDYVFRCVRYG